MSVSHVSPSSGVKSQKAKSSSANPVHLSKSNMLVRGQGGGKSARKPEGELEEALRQTVHAPILNPLPKAVEYREEKKSRGSLGGARRSGGTCTTLPDSEFPTEPEFPPGFEKLKQLGKGGSATVWLAGCLSESVSSVLRSLSPLLLDRKTLYAVKHTCKNGERKQPEVQAARKEIAFAEMLYEIQCVDLLKHGGREDQETEVEGRSSHERNIGTRRHPGFDRISRFYGYCESKRSIWLVQGMEGQSLSKLLFDIKGEFVGSERVYRVRHGPVLQAMLKDVNVLKLLIRQLLECLELLSSLSVVHADLKPDNILISSSPSSLERFSFKVIDFGSSFSFSPSSSSNSSHATPEYMPPEALHQDQPGANPGGAGPGYRQGHRLSMAERLLAAPKTSGPQVEFTPAPSKPWSFDMWSVGAVVLEIVHGVPLWLSYKGVLQDVRTGKDRLVTGLFASAQRHSNRILGKQVEVVKSLRKLLQSGFVTIELPPSGLDLLTQMLDLNASRRISPQSALCHPFLRGRNSVMNDRKNLRGLRKSLIYRLAHH